MDIYVYYFAAKSQSVVREVGLPILIDMMALSKVYKNLRQCVLLCIMCAFWFSVLE